MRIWESEMTVSIKITSLIFELSRGLMYFVIEL